MKKFFKEFKEFALRGSVMDLAIGVIIGAAFQAIVNSLVKDIMSPLIGLVAKTDLSDLSVEIGKKNKPEEAEEPAVKTCPFCMTEIDIKATRCPHCTSHLDEVFADADKD